MREKFRPITQFGRDAFEHLGLSIDATVEQVDERWRTLRSAVHPDRPGGDAQKFHLARVAYNEARFWSLEPKPCAECGGSGKRPPERYAGIGTREDSLRLNCRACKGSGAAR